MKVDLVPHKVFKPGSNFNLGKPTLLGEWGEGGGGGRLGTK